MRRILISVITAVFLAVTLGGFSMMPENNAATEIYDVWIENGADNIEVPLDGAYQSVNMQVGTERFLTHKKAGLVKTDYAWGSSDSSRVKITDETADSCVIHALKVTTDYVTVKHYYTFLSAYGYGDGVVEFHVYVWDTSGGGGGGGGGTTHDPDKAGPNATWELDEATKTLTIKGEGEMYNYSETEHTPWLDKPYENVVVEEGITTVGNYAFCSKYEISKVKNVTLPSSLTKIGKSAFERCGDLESISLPDKISVIDEGAFAACSSLSSVKLPANLLVIKELAFNGCPLTTIEFPERLVEIEEYAFYYTSFTEVYLPKNIAKIGSCAFRNLTVVSPLTDVYFEGDAPIIGDFCFVSGFSLDEWATVHYIPTTKGWSNEIQYSAAGVLNWHGYPVVEWEGRFLLGDLNTSGGDPDVLDGVVMQRILAGLEPEIPAADLNGSGDITVADGVVMQRILAGLE